MTAIEPATIARWPDVPACYDWLSLDRRGAWRLQGERVVHGGLVRFLNAGYASDGAGNWLVRNGPQRVFVTLDYAPWVLRLEADGGVVTHTGVAAGAVEAVHLDEEGCVLLQTAVGPGLLDDRDLVAFIAACRGVDGGAADDSALLSVMQGGDGVFWRGLPLQAVARDEVPARFGFCPRPRP